jgi:hypothetical protein
MRAQPNDEIVVSGHQVGEHERHGVIVAVEGADGAPPYRVRWDGSDHVTLFFPGSDAAVVHVTPAR